MMKITQEMREKNGVPTEMNKAKAAAAAAEGKNGETSGTTDLSASEKNIGAQPAGGNNQSNEDISPEGLLNVIS